MSVRVECKCGVAIEGNDVLVVIALTEHHDETCKSKEQS